MLNMIIEFLEKTSRNLNSSSRPIIVRFNPWNYPEQDKILMQFFYNLSLKLKSKRLKKFQRLGDQVLRYADSFIPFDVTVDSLRKSISLKLRNKDKKSIDYKKEKLIKGFQQLKNKIIIIIDDVDRLGKNEIKQIIQLTKAFGNFPNIIYVVAFDREIVSRSLSDENMKNGEEYLEKIIQVPFEIPTIPRDKVLGILEFQLTEVLNSVPKKTINQEYWNNIYYGSIQYFFNTIRDINRYINTLKISMPFIITEINPIDFIAIACLQVFLPSVYLGIKNNKELLTKAPEQFQKDLKNEADYGIKKTVNSLIETVPKKEQDHIKYFLSYLFPVLKGVFNCQTVGTEVTAKIAQKEMRICVSNYFDIYFRLSVPDYEINQEEIENLIYSSDSETEFSSMLLMLNKKGKISVAIDNLKYKIKDISFENRHKVINSLLDISDRFKIDDANSTKYNEIVYLCLDILFRIDDEEERFRVLENAIKNARSLYISTELIIKLADESKKGEFLIDGFKVLILEDLMVHKIRNWVKGEKINKNPKFHAIL